MSASVKIEWHKETQKNKLKLHQSEVNNSINLTKQKTYTTFSVP